MRNLLFPQKTKHKCYVLCAMYKYRGIPKVILNGKVTAKAIGRYKLGLALGAANLIAAGTAI